MLTVEQLEVPPNDFLSGEPEDAAFFLGFHKSKIQGIRTGCLAVRRGCGVVAIVPYFLLDFRINTMLPRGWLKNALGWVRLRVACVGHPSLDLGRIHGEVSGETLAAVNGELHKLAALVGYKGYPDDLPLTNFVRVKNLPQATLRIPADFYERLTSKKRNDLNRKRKRGASIHVVEHCGRTQGLSETLAGEIHRLYLNTHDQSPVQLELLTADYFVHTAPLCTYLLFYEEQHLIGFAQILGTGKSRALKYVGMDYDRGPKYGLWFLMYLRAIDHCIRIGCECMELGQTTYEFKKYLGCELTDSWLYYHHRQPIMHWLLSKTAFLLEPSEEELK